MDRLAACHLMHGFLHAPGTRRRHPTSPNCQHMKTAQRSLSLADRRGITSPAWSSRRGLVSPMPHHGQHCEPGEEMDEGHHSMKRIHNMSLVMQIVDFSHLGTIGGRGGTAASTAAIPEMVVPVRGAPFDRSTAMQWRQPAPSLMPSAQFRRQSTAPKKASEAGEIMLSICYLPQLGKLAVTIVKARDLPSRDKFYNTDPYVKMWLVQKGRKIEKRKTMICPQTQEPIYNESFSFGNLPSRESLVHEVNLVVTVMDYDLVTVSGEIGHVIIGALGGESGARHWTEAIDHCDSPVTVWHKLSPKW